MARKPTPDGKRVTACTKFSEAEADRMDAARGALTRSEWLRSLALAAIEPEPAARPAPKRRPPAASRAPVAADLPPQATPQRASKAGHRCPVKGWCEPCGEWKGAKR